MYQNQTNATRPFHFILIHCSNITNGTGPIPFDLNALFKTITEHKEQNITMIVLYSDYLYGGDDDTH